MPTLENIIKAVKAFRKLMADQGKPVSFDHAIDVICKACDCEIVVRRCANGR